MIHVLQHGRALCRFHTGVPRDWPPGHVWVGFTDVALKALSKNVGRCPQCFALAVDEATSVQRLRLEGFEVEWHDDYPDVWIMTCACGHVGVWDRSANKTFGCSGCGAGPLHVAEPERLKLNFKCPSCGSDPDVDCICKGAG